MAGSFLRPLAILLVVSQLIFWSVTSSSSKSTNLRTEDHLFYNSQDMLSSDQNTHHQTITKQGAGRENLEYNDYSGTGANDRHTPDSPSGPGQNN
ncbi:unnamed protein product [Dovyalis caffra]|uniref:Uncharacterized protein n=1 Tax=Dovyalis caffra TaxID=77055 RepID=A0AAV1QZ96_9ROSI|nr:unnamed protein product [Dovyalis caffra]